MLQSLPTDSPVLFRQPPYTLLTDCLITALTNGWKTQHQKH